MTNSAIEQVEKNRILMNDKRLRVSTDFSESFTQSERIQKILGQSLPSSMRGISLDSRTIEAGDVFFAIPGKNGADGHDYVKRALDKGAAAAVVSKPMTELNEEKLIYVEDTVLSLQEIAKAWRQAWNKTLIAITGSNGKTSTKYICYQLLSTQFKITPPRNSWNNELGVPLSLLSIAQDDGLHIVELGMNHTGEIYPLSEIAQPDIAGITNIGSAHIGFFKDIDGIAKEKKQLWEWLNKHNSKSGVAIVNLDDVRLAQSVFNSNEYQFNTVSFSAKDKSADVHLIADVNRAFFQYGHWGPIENTSELIGTHNLNNILFGLAVAFQLNVDLRNIVKVLPKIYLPSLRQESILLKDGLLLLADCYNANLDSTLVAIDTLVSMSQSNKVLILGDMAENGRFSEKNHLLVAQAIEEQPSIQTIFCFGEKTKVIANYFDQQSLNRCIHFKDKNALLNALKQAIKKDMVIMFKGSRSNALETLVESLQDSPELRKVG